MRKLIFVVATFVLCACNNDFGKEAKKCEGLFGGFNSELCSHANWLFYTHSSLVVEMRTFFHDTEEWPKNDATKVLLEELEKIYSESKENTFNNRKIPSFDSEELEKMLGILDQLEEESHNGRVYRIPRVEKVEKAVRKALWVSKG